MVAMNRLSTADRARVVASLVEGNSIRATACMTGVAKNTIAKLLVDLGAACSAYQDKTIRNVRSKRVRYDEIRSFVGSKEKNTSDEKKAAGCGDCWTWTALDAEHSPRFNQTDPTTHASANLPPGTRHCVRNCSSQ